MSAKAYLYLGLAAALVGLLWLAGNGLYEAGETAERLRWEEAARSAQDAARLEEQRDTVASDGARDAAAQEGAAASRDAREQTTTTIETIRYVYRNQPAPACPAAPVPDGVRDALNAAYDAASAASRGLPAAAGP